MKTIKLRNLEIGSGKPKIIIPIAEVEKENILAQAKLFKGVALDMVEWRVDFFRDVLDSKKVIDILSELRTELEDTPLLFTIRTKSEGGEIDISEESYTELNKSAANSGFVDAVDVEAFSSGQVAIQNIKNIHDANVLVVGSNHDFFATPSHEEIVRRLCKMQDMGVDIPKIAVMPQSKSDVLILLSATEEMSSKFANGPIITMSMSEIGAVSRICGEVVGSSMTFGTLGKASAPGQIPLKELNTAMDILHKSMQIR